MKGLRIYLRAEEPLFLSKSTVNNTIYATSDYISGCRFLGALANHWNYQNPKLVALKDPDFRAMFLTGEVFFGNATIDCQGSQCLPMPLCFVQESKMDQNDGAIKALNLLKDGQHNDLPTLSGYFESKTKQTCDVHIGQIGSNISRNGPVKFISKENISPKTPFIGEIYCQDGIFAKMKALLQKCPSLQIGAGRFAGYGTITISQIEEFNVEDTVAVSAGEHTFFLTSGFLPLTEWETPLSGFLTYLKQYLGDVELIKDKVFTDHERVNGFNALWNMPRTTRVSLMPGSVITVKTSKAGKLPFVIGRDPNEGFGRYLLDPAFLKDASLKLTLYQQEDPSEILSKTTPDVPFALLPKWRERSLLRIGEEQAIECAWNSPVFNGFIESLKLYDKPSQSQRGNILRLILGKPTSAWIPTFTTMLGKSAGRQWKSVRVTDPFSQNKQRGHLDEIMLKLFDMQQTDACINAQFAPYKSLPEVPGAALTPGEIALFHVERHKRLLVELLRRWEK